MQHLQEATQKISHAEGMVRQERFFHSYKLRQSRATPACSRGFSVICSAEVLFSPPQGSRSSWGSLHSWKSRSSCYESSGQTTGELLWWHQERDSQTWHDYLLPVEHQLTQVFQLLRTSREAPRTSELGKEET